MPNGLLKKMSGLIQGCSALCSRYAMWMSRLKGYLVRISDPFYMVSWELCKSASKLFCISSQARVTPEGSIKLHIMCISLRICTKTSFLKLFSFQLVSWSRAGVKNYWEDEVSENVKLSTCHVNWLNKLLWIIWEVYKKKVKPGLLAKPPLPPHPNLGPFIW